MVQEVAPRGSNLQLQKTGLAIILAAHADSTRGVYEHLLEMEVADPVLDRLQEIEQLCREAAVDLNRI